MVKPKAVRFSSICPHCEKLVVFNMSKKELKKILKALRVTSGRVEIDAVLVLRKEQEIRT